MKKRAGTQFLSIFLVVVIVLGLIPVPVFAEDGADYTELNDYNIQNEYCTEPDMPQEPEEEPSEPEISDPEDYDTGYIKDTDDIDNIDRESLPLIPYIPYIPGIPERGYFIDRSALRAALEEAQALYQEDFTPEEWAALQLAVLQAIIIYEDGNAVQSEIDEAEYALRAVLDELMGIAAPYAFGAPVFKWEYLMERGLEHIVDAVPAPQFGTVGGEWAVLALARANHPVPAGYFESYIYHIGERLMGVGITADPNSTQNAGGLFPLNRVYNAETGKYEVRLGNQAQSTENSRLVVALSSLGVDASNFTHNGTTFDLIAQFGQRNNATSNQMWGELQGINGPIWNLIALNSHGWGNPYQISDRAWVGGTTTSNPISLDERIEWVLGVQLNNGGWSLSHFNSANANSAAGASDPDMTAMAIQALAPYRARADVSSAIDRALTELSETQLPNGGWVSMGTDNVQSPAQVIVALTSLGIDPQLDERFIMPYGNPVTTISRFFDSNSGGFKHPLSFGVNLMATEQVVYGLVAYQRFLQGDNPLYDMSDAFGTPQAALDKTVLNSEIARAAGRVWTNYTVASWAWMQSALTAAKQVRDDSNTTQADINNAANNLNSAINALVTIPAVSRAALNNEITRALGRTQANYTLISWNIMQNSLSSAIQIRDNANATQSQIDTAADNLRGAINNLIPAPIPPMPNRARVWLSVVNPNARAGDPTLFLQGGTVADMYIYINNGETAYSILRRPEAGLNIRSAGHHTWSGMYIEAINGWSEFDGGPLSGWMYAVNRVFPDFSASLYELRDGDRLVWAYTYELGSDLGSLGGGSGMSVVERAVLRAEIERAEALIQANYTAASWTNMQVALTAARQVLNNATATQAQVNAAINSLRAAREALVRTAGAAANVSKAELNAEIDRVESMIPANYTAASWLRVERALNAARQVRDNAAATQIQVNAATDSLRAAVNSLVREIMPSPGLIAPEVSAAAELEALIEYSTAFALAGEAFVSGLIARAREESASNITINIPIPQTVSRVETEFIMGRIKEIAADNLSLTIQSGIGGINFDTATLAGLALNVDADAAVNVIIEIIDAENALNSRQQAVVGDNLAISLTVMVGGNTISNFNGNVMVTIPYSPSIPAEDYDLLTVYYLDYEGNIREMKGAGYSGSQIRFMTKHFSIFFVSEWISPFADVTRNDWHFRNIRFAYSNGLMGGVSDGQFSPSTNLSRAMMVTMLWRLEGMPAATDGNTFYDIMPGRWYSDAVAWASANGIVSGFGNGSFEPDSNITREQFAVILQNYAIFTGQNVNGGTFASEFADADNISAWAREAMEWANTNGFITGRTISTLAPSGTATRAEAAAIMQRFIEAQ